MTSSNFYPEKVFIQEAALNYSLTQKVLKKLTPVPQTVVRNTEEVLETTLYSRDPLGQGKKSLFLCLQKGEFIKPFPCAPGLRPC